MKLCKSLMTLSLVGISISFLACSSPRVISDPKDLPIKTDTVPPTSTQFHQILEASGIVRKRDHFVIVGDESPGDIFEQKITTTDYSHITTPRLDNILADKATKRNIAGNMAMDLEGVAISSDGEIVLLSERLNALLTKDTVIIAEYPDQLTEVAARGLEGLAISSKDSVLAMWEGGHFVPKKNPSKVKSAHGSITGPMNPLFCIHHLNNSKPCAKGVGIKVLEVPQPQLNNQAFRAPDVIWSSDEESIIVLLSSTDATDREFGYKWLQRFTKKGIPISDPLNLCDTGYLPKKLRSDSFSNFEGLAWFERGESIMLINDNGSGHPSVVILDLNPWPKTDPTVKCSDKVP